MHIHVNGRNIEITDAIKAYVKEKAGKVVAHYEQIDAIDAIPEEITDQSAGLIAYAQSCFNELKYSRFRDIIVNHVRR